MGLERSTLDDHDLAEAVSLIEAMDAPLTAVLTAYSASRWWARNSRPRSAISTAPRLISPQVR